jgi:hypothetical protein
MVPPPSRDLSFERTLYESIVARDPANVEALMALGEAYTRDRDYARGLEVDQCLARLRPSDPVVLYNLACSHALLGRTDTAFEVLGRAVDLGYADLPHLDGDPDLEGIRKDIRFAEIRERLLKRSEVSKISKA